jgi:hypothetical protein
VSTRISRSTAEPIDPPFGHPQFRHRSCGNVHDGDRKECEKYRASFEAERYVGYGTNEYNFETLPDPPSFEPKHGALAAP